MSFNLTIDFSPPDRLVIDKLLTKFRQQIVSHDDEIAHLKQEIDSHTAQKENLETTIGVLTDQLALLPTGEALTEPTDAELGDLQGHSSVKEVKTNTEVHAARPEKSSWQKPSEPWIELIKKIIRERNDLILVSDLVSELGMDDTALDDHRSTISGAFTSYRNSGVLAGVKIYRRSKKWKPAVFYVCGFLEFF